MNVGVLARRASRSTVPGLDVACSVSWSLTLVFSFIGRCHGLCASAKYTLMPVACVNAACSASSLPRSQQSVRIAFAGSVDVLATSASFKFSAP